MLFSVFEPDYIIGAAAVIEKLFLRGDYIIRGANYSGKVVDPLDIITKTMKWLDISHAVLNDNNVAYKGQ